MCFHIIIIFPHIILILLGASCEVQCPQSEKH